MTWRSYEGIRLKISSENPTGIIQKCIDEFFGNLSKNSFRNFSKDSLCIAVGIPMKVLLRLLQKFLQGLILKLLVQLEISPGITSEILPGFFFRFGYSRRNCTKIPGRVLEIISKKIFAFYSKIDKNTYRYS